MNYMKSLVKVLNHPTNRHQIGLTIGRILWWKFNQLFFHLPAKVNISKKSALLCYPETSFGSYVVYARLPEYAETLFVQKFLKPNSVFLDVGAHLGEYALLAAEVSSKGTIIAFEPTPSSRQLLHENIALNTHAHHVKVSDKAVSFKQGTAYFSLEPEAEVNHLSSSVKKGQKTIKVSTTTIDDLRKKYQLSKIDLIKIDVEGAELDVLKGARQTIKAKALPVVIFELNPLSEWYQQQPSPMFTLLQKSGYTFFAFTEQGNLKPFQTELRQKSTINIVAVQQSALQTIKKFLRK